MRTLLALTLLAAAPLAAPARPDGDAYANPELLVTPAWVAEHGTDPGVVVLDTRSPSDFAKGHVPGARNLPTSATFAPSSGGDIGSAEAIAGLLGALGVSNDSHVVLYDEGRSTSAARVFWTLESYGHAHVSVVDGGFPRWEAEKREVSKDTPHPEPVKYTPGKLTKSLSTTDDLLAGLDDPQCCMLDARSTREYAGGRVPGAVRIEWDQNYERHDDGTYGLLAPAALAKLYADAGVTKDKRVHAY